MYNFAIYNILTYEYPCHAFEFNIVRTNHVMVNEA